MPQIVVDQVDVLRKRGDVDIHIAGLKLKVLPGIKAGRVYTMLFEVNSEIIPFTYISTGERCRYP